MTSRDDGTTWTFPRVLRDGRLLMTYGHRHEPFGNQARVSTDNGRTWSEPVTVSGDGTLLTVWYEALQDRPRAVLRQARRTLEGAARATETLGAHAGPPARPRRRMAA
jgi:hypothetical protein